MDTTTAVQPPASSTDLLDGPRVWKAPPERRQSLLELWLDVEPFLTSEERATLGSGTFEVLFPDSGRPRPSRCGQPSGGGY